MRNFLYINIAAILLALFTSSSALAVCCQSPSYGSGGCSGCSSGQNGCISGAAAVCCYNPNMGIPSCYPN